MNNQNWLKRKILKAVICGLHFVVLAYFVLTPFLSGRSSELRDYLLYSSFLWAHWYLNNDVCALTMIESYCFDLPKDQTFFGNLVSPIYKITNREIYFGHFLLVLIALGRWLTFKN